MFITCFFGVLDPRSGSLTYANAGHDLPYLWRGGEAEERRARGTPLGLMPGMDYEQKETVLERSDSTLFLQRRVRDPPTIMSAGPAPDLSKAILVPSLLLLVA